MGVFLVSLVFHVMTSFLPSLMSFTAIINEHGEIMTSSTTYFNGLR